MSDPRLSTAYKLSTPLQTHFRTATCAEVQCKHFLNGWQMKIDVTLPIGQRQAYLISQSRRKFSRVVLREHTIYTFEAGQTCFKQHRTKSERPALYIVRQGAEVRQHVRPEYWVEDFSTHLDKIKEQ